MLTSGQQFSPVQMQFNPQFAYIDPRHQRREYLALLGDGLMAQGIR
jgi:hypothetical protein